MQLKLVQLKFQVGATQVSSWCNSSFKLVQLKLVHALWTVVHALGTVVQDVLQALHNTLLSLQTYPTIKHVKSHQDDDKPVEELPLSAQLNVEADAMATEGLRWACPTPHVTFDPTSQVMLAVAGDSCTTDIKPLVRASHHFQPLMEYYKERFQFFSTFSTRTRRETCPSYCNYHSQPQPLGLCTASLYTKDYSWVKGEASKTP